MADVGEDLRKIPFDEDKNYEDDGENISLLERPHPSKMRETQRPYKARTSTGKKKVFQTDSMMRMMRRKHRLGGWKIYIM